MFFNASKIFWLIAEPVSVAIFVGLLGIVLLFTRFARAGRALMAGAMIALAVGSLTPIGVVLLRPLEDRFPQPSAAMPPPTGIIVLGGAVDTARSESRRQVYLDADAARMTAAVDLARRYPNARLVFTGGSAGFPYEGLAEAISVRELWLSLGVPAEQMVFEEKSRNTWENAVFTRSRQAKAWRDLAARDLSLAHAAIGRHIPPRWLSGRALSGRLPHFWRRTRVQGHRLHSRQIGYARFGRARMDRPFGLSARR